MEILNNLRELASFTPLPALVIVLLTFLVAYLFRRFYFRRLLNTSMIINNPTSYKFVGHLVSGMIYVVGFAAAIYTIPKLKTLAGSMLAGAGIATVVIGFASQNALSNIVSGLFIVIFKPFRVNDRLEIKESLSGIVEDITLRHTVIRNFRNQRIVIPNSIISDEVVINSDMGDSTVCRWLDFGISYDSSIDKAREIIADEVGKHPALIDVRTPEDLEADKPLVTVRVISLGDSSVNLRAFAWAATSADGFDIMCDTTESIKKRFDAEGVEIPFPHRTLIMKNEQPINN